MSDFSDADDRALYRLVKAFADKNSRIDWDHVAHRMRHTGKSRAALRERLKTLKKTHGKDLSRFPLFFARELAAKSLLPISSTHVSRMLPLSFAQYFTGLWLCRYTVRHRECSSQYHEVKCGNSQVVGILMLANWHLKESQHSKRRWVCCQLMSLLILGVGSGMS